MYVLGYMLEEYERSAFTSWEEVRKTPFYVKDYTLQFGNDAILSISGLLLKQWRERFLTMLYANGAVLGF